MHCFLFFLVWFFPDHIISQFNLRGRKHGSVCNIIIDMKKSKQSQGRAFEKQPQQKPCSALVTFMTWTLFLLRKFVCDDSSHLSCQQQQQRPSIKSLQHAYVMLHRFQDDLWSDLNTGMFTIIYMQYNMDLAMLSKMLKKKRKHTHPLATSRIAYV